MKEDWVDRAAKKIWLEMPRIEAESGQDAQDDQEQEAGEMSARNAVAKIIREAFETALANSETP